MIALVHLNVIIILVSGGAAVLLGPLHRRDRVEDRRRRQGGAVGQAYRTPHGVAVVPAAPLGP